MDHVEVAELPIDGAYEPQLYKITITPALNGKRPELDFLHKGDGIVLDDGTTYIVQHAKQQYVPLKNSFVFGDGRWIWSYTATAVPTNNEEEGRPW